MTTPDTQPQSDHRNGGGTNGNGKAKPAPAPSPKPAPSTEVLLYGGDLLAFVGNEEPNEDDDCDWMIRGLLARGMLTMLVADPKVGKTLLALDWAIAIAAGEAQWCGHSIPEAVRGARVLVMPKEDIPRVTVKRVWQFCRGHGVRPHDLVGRLEFDPISPLYLDERKYFQKLSATAKSFDVILIDSLSKIHHGDESSAKDMAPMISRTADLASATQTSIGILHHLGGKGQVGDYRGVGHKMRGSSTLFAAARWVVGIERREAKDPSKGIIFTTDGNLGYRPPPFVARLNEDRHNGHASLGYLPLGSAAASKRDDARERADQRAAEKVRKVRADIIESLEAAGGKLSCNAVLVRDGIRWVPHNRSESLKQLTLMAKEGLICTSPDGDVCWAKTLVIE